MSLLAVNLAVAISKVLVSIGIILWTPKKEMRGTENSGMGSLYLKPILGPGLDVRDDNNNHDKQHTGQVLFLLL